MSTPIVSVDKNSTQEVRALKSCTGTKELVSVPTWPPENILPIAAGTLYQSTFNNYSFLNIEAGVLRFHCHGNTGFKRCYWQILLWHWRHNDSRIIVNASLFPHFYYLLVGLPPRDTCFEFRSPRDSRGIHGILPVLPISVQYPGRHAALYQHYRTWPHTTAAIFHSLVFVIACSFSASDGDSPLQTTQL